MEPSNTALLRTFLSDAGLPHDEGTLGSFAAFAELLLQGNRRMNLIGKLDERAVVEELFCDSLQLLALGTELEGPVIDVGSGAGLPGLPIKLAAPELEVVLVEPREKRYYFQGHVVRTLGLKGVERKRGRIEDLHLPPAGFACSKAFTGPERWLPIADSLIKDGGAIGVLASALDWDALDLTALPYRVEAQRTYQWGDGPPRVAAILRRR